MQIVWMVLSAMLILTGLVAIHEYGHYLAAKKRGIRVSQFAIGMGPKLLKWQRGETEFSLRPLLFGGYVMFADDTEDEPTPGGFRSAPVASRAIVAAAGPIMNVLVAAVLAIIMVFSASEYHAVRVASVEPGSPAELAGVQEGDILRTVNGVSFDFYAPALQEYQVTPREQTMALTATRDGEEYETEILFEPGDVDRLMGVTMEPAPHGVWESITLALKWLGEQTTLIFDVLGDLFFHGSGVENMTGIVGTTVVVGSVVQYGNVGMILMLISVISINLAIVNLLPIPALDGGKLLMYGIESVSKKSASARLEGALNFAGMAVIMAFAGYLVFQDIARLAG